MGDQDKKLEHEQELREAGDAGASPADEYQESPANNKESHSAGQVEEDIDELVTKAAERDEYLALAQRAQADFENYRKRMTREVSLAAERGIEKAVKLLLTPMDNLDRALAHIDEQSSGADDEFIRGIRLVADELHNALNQLGVVAYSPRGEQFDPNFHEAMAQHSIEGATSGTIAEVYQKGYRLGENVIRPARVVVAE